MHLNSLSDHKLMEQQNLQTLLSRIDWASCMFREEHIVHLSSKPDAHHHQARMFAFCQYLKEPMYYQNLLEDAPIMLKVTMKVLVTTLFVRIIAIPNTQQLKEGACSWQFPTLDPKVIIIYFETLF